MGIDFVAIQLSTDTRYNSPVNTCNKRFIVWQYSLTFNRKSPVNGFILAIIAWFNNAQKSTKI